MPNDIRALLRALLGGTRGDIDLTANSPSESPRIKHEPLRPFSMGANPPPSQEELLRAVFLSGPEPRARDIELKAPAPDVYAEQDYSDTLPRNWPKGYDDPGYKAAVAREASRRRRR